MIPMRKIERLQRLIALISRFIPVRDGRDRRWSFILREGRRWTRLRAVKYEGSFYFSGSGFDYFNYPDKRELDPEIAERLPAWLRELERWKKAVARDPIEAQALLLKKLPLSERAAVMLRRNVRILLPSWMPLASELGRRERDEILDLLEHPPREGQERMTLRRFLGYCRVAYQANPATFLESGFRPGLSGMAYYKRYADGRHGGLIELPLDSAQAFEAWYGSKSWSGCHPWEIYRGGNSTHIDMYVTRREFAPRTWEVHLRAPSSTRLVETCRIARALARAHLPVLVDGPKSYIDRILDQDWVGIVPGEGGLADARQSFPEEWGVQDCVPWDWFHEVSKNSGRRLKRLLRTLAYCLPEDITACVRL